MSLFRLYAATIAVAGLIFTVDAHAGSAAGTVNYVLVRARDGLTYTTISGSYSDKPSCATNGYWMIKDENSTAGKHQLALLLMAQATGKIVTIYGTNTCTRWSDGEDIDWVKVQ